MLKELAVFATVYGSTDFGELSSSLSLRAEGSRIELAEVNLVRGVMLESASRQRASPLRLSFADALAWVCHAERGHQWPTLKIVPLRPGRIEPRAVKRGPKPFDLMNRPRDEMRKRAREKLGAIAHETTCVAI